LCGGCSHGLVCDSLQQLSIRLLQKTINSCTSVFSMPSDHSRWHLEINTSISDHTSVLQLTLRRFKQVAASAERGLGLVNITSCS